MRLSNTAQRSEKSHTSPSSRTGSRLATASTRALRLVVAATLIGMALAAWPAPIALAATITVNTTNDEVNNDGDCSLREAIIAANTDTAVDACPAGNGADTIVLPAGNYVLSIAGVSEEDAQTGDLDIREDLTLNGAGRANTTIDANGLDRVLHIILSDVDISGVTITGGDTPSAVGSGINVYTGSSLTLTGSRVTGNGPQSGIYATFSALALTIVDSRIDNNTGFSGGGLDFSAGPTVTIIDSVINANSATLYGGGIDSPGALTIINSTVSGNSATFNGGGIYSSGALNLHNVTLANNDAGGDGGGIYIASGYADVFTATNSIIANNSAASYNDCYSADRIPGSQFGYNLLEDTTGCTPFSGFAFGNILAQAPQLDPLAFNGGQTLTHALRAGSPAVDAGGPLQCRDSNSVLLTTDQRGYARPIDGDGDSLAICDMGAYEYNSPGPPTPTATATPSNTPTATRTNTPSPTPTRTPTATRTNTPSPTPTRTPTATASATPSPTRTNTPSPTPTRTPTTTRTNTPTATATRTPTVTASVTPSPTRTNTSSPTPTRTPTATVTRTPTATATNTPGPSPTNTSTPTRTPTATATRTPTATSTATATATTSPTATVVAAPMDYWVYLPIILK